MRDWPIGKVLSLKHGRDGIARQVEYEILKDGKKKRCGPHPVQHVAPLELDEIHTAVENERLRKESERVQKLSVMVATSRFVKIIDRTKNAD